MKPKLDPFRKRAQFPAFNDGIDMEWRTHDGKTLMASTMQTRHMFYALRLLYNKTVPPEYQIGGYSNPFFGERNKYGPQIQVFFHLLTQPQRESEITDEMWLDIAKMQKVVREIL